MIVEQIDSAKNSPGGEGVLQSFFNSLLSRKSGSPGGVGSPRTPNNALPDNRRSDVQAELDRMIGTNRIGSNTSTPTHKLNVSTSSEQ